MGEKMIHDIKWIFRNKFARWEKFKFIIKKWLKEVE